MNDYISGIHHHGAHQGEYVTHHDHPVTIDAVHGARILDSRGYPTVRVSLELDDGRTVTGDAPAGASTGAHEAVELRDGGAQRAARPLDRLGERRAVVRGAQRLAVHGRRRPAHRLVHLPDRGDVDRLVDEQVRRARVVEHVAGEGDRGGTENVSRHV